MNKKLTILAAVALTTFAFNVNTYADTIRVPYDYATIQEAVVAAQDYDEIMVAPGLYSGAIIDKPVTIRGAAHATLIIDGVPFKVGSSLETAFRLDSGADGTEISHLTIPNNANNLYFFAVFSSAVDEVSLNHLTITNPIQAISNYDGNNWTISHNKISGVIAAGGGGIGILIGATLNNAANDNIISHNTISGEIGNVGFTGPAILLTSLHGSHQIPGGDVTGNKILKNKGSHTGSNGVGFEADDVTLAGDPPGPPTIFDNKIAFNDFRGSTSEQNWQAGVDSENANTYSRNLGNNRRADGLNPAKIFHDK